MIRVVLTGAAGRMGRVAAATLSSVEGLSLVGAVDPSAVGESLRHVAGPGAADLTVAASWAGWTSAGVAADVLVDLTHGEVAASNALAAAEAGVMPVIGATGMPPARLLELDELARQRGIPALVVPNFALGAVLMMRFAAMAAKWMPEVEIIELHHDGKRDAPSGTARRTAELIAEARGSRDGAPSDWEDRARGDVVAGVRVHSVRLPGLVAHQEVLLGGRGETLTLRHDSLDRSSFMGGLVVAVRGVSSLPPGLTTGLEHLLPMD